jgi:YebC/PmpR family DNA-binding regulatory protein
MAGHSKWANIKHRKARQDAVKGKNWSKCSRAIMVAVRNGSPDPTMNLTLRYAIEEARACNMAKDTIEKAIKKASGEGDDAAKYEETRYEGYGTGGVAIIVDCLTDNVNRTAPEMRKIFEKGGGNLAKPGAVSFGFTSKGVIIIEASATDEESLMDLVLEAGADDINDIGGAWEVTCDPAAFLTVKDAIDAKEIPTVSAAVTMIPSTMVDCDHTAASKVLRLLEELEDHDDVQKVYCNADMPDDLGEGA